MGASIVALVAMMGRTAKTAKSEKKDVEGGLWRRAGGLTQAESRDFFLLQSNNNLCVYGASSSLPLIIIRKTW